MEDSILAFDVGGTYVKAGIFACDGKMLGSLSIHPARSGEAREELLQHFTDLVKIQGMQVPAGYAIRGVGLAFPGPFDYEQGICLTRGLNKFESLYGVNLKEELTARISEIPELQDKWSHAPEVAFENDAALFALGECAFGVGRSYEKAICLTIGTGFGTAFVKNGQLIKQAEGVPTDGWMFRLPYREGIMDDYISRRGIVRLAEEMGIKQVAAGEEDVKQLAERARSGETQAVQLFREFGERLMEVLRPFFQSFQPDAVIIGGQIARSADLFVSDFMENVPVLISSDMSVSALRGACRLFTGAQEG
ncbi:ROK family protein [Paenibacillus sp. KQZ6P-2]|uniref:ROK family protein n=1 Tax=Paenibacillus mangrovi TaxID=2931978 RepID=A0A9X2B2W7_9BACL|nr:ROK family protein [Paenibacillus mangrovi]MCJ8012721.1 ROK family protein [Paenibacillus mangrovi]